VTPDEVKLKRHLFHQHHEDTKKWRGEETERQGGQRETEKQWSREKGRQRDRKMERQINGRHRNRVREVTKTDSWESGRMKR
jgi:hypothetical protein